MPSYVYDIVMTNVTGYVRLALKTLFQPFVPRGLPVGPDFRSQDLNRNLPPFFGFIFVLGNKNMPHAAIVKTLQ